MVSSNPYNSLNFNHETDMSRLSLRGSPSVSRKSSQQFLVTQPSWMPVHSSQDIVNSMYNSSICPSSNNKETLSNETQKAFLKADVKGRGDKFGVCRECRSELSLAQRSLLLTREEGECVLCLMKEGKPEAYTKPFCNFLTENPTIFHAVDYFKDKLTEAGFTELSMRDNWESKVTPGGKYWTTRNGSAIIAFIVGPSYTPGNGVAMVVGHIDALTAKLKPVSHKPNRNGFIELGVAPYAGALNATWWDRDLSIGGRVVVRDEKGKTMTRLVKLGWPIARVPTLAPHFGVGMMGTNNAETQAVPIIGLDNSDLTGATAKTEEALGDSGSFASKQPPKLVKLIAKELKITDYSQIVNWELELYDSQPAQTGGMDHEFIFGGRIDDKLCSWAAFHGLLATDTKEDDSYIKLVALFDDEEIGSLLRQGAKSNFLPIVIERAVESLVAAKSVSFGPGLVGQTYARSFLLSADVTHAANPNFLGNHLDEHMARLNVGVTICADSNGHMTTDAISTSVLTRVGELAGCTTQTFMIRNDSRSGGTVGPTLSSMMGVKAADAGLPQLSMHSVRATTGSLDPGLGVKFFKGFLDLWEQIDGEWH